MDIGVSSAFEKIEEYFGVATAKGVMIAVIAFIGLALASQVMSVIGPAIDATNNNSTYGLIFLFLTRFFLPIFNTIVVLCGIAVIVSLVDTKRQLLEAIDFQRKSRENYEKSTSYLTSLEALLYKFAEGEITGQELNDRMKESLPQVKALTRSSDTLGSDL
ncbi:hypothetical protein NKJ86_08870 [Mesorhizobium sp. M0025]|uniref:hypothetical protein n=1 Tax=Mesorhizobium sp. M0025 TaxID=2956846 RepID=UPI00333631AB